MTINPNDPKWTAYVLGDLDPDERAAIERVLEASEEARNLVEEIRSATTLLREEWTAPRSVTLSADQRAAIHAAANARVRRAGWHIPAWAGGLAAAGLVLAAVSTPTLLRSRQEATQSAATEVRIPGAPPSDPVPAEGRQVRASAGPPAAVQQQALEKDQSLRDARFDAFSAEKEVRNKVEIVASAAAPAGGVMPPDVRRPSFNTEAYDRITDNPFIRVSQDPLATFSIDVDTASYANVRRFINQNQLPPKDAVRIEELINYFNYDYPQPSGAHPIAAYTEVAAAPWKPEHRLVRIGIKAKDLDLNRRPPSNLVFLIDVSGSMQPAEKLPLLKNAMKLLVDKLTENDRVSMIVYAGASGMVLRPTSGDMKDVIMRALDDLEAGGSTNGGSGIQLAYELAVSNYIRGGINRVILATDGDFNVGMTNQGDLIRLIEEKAKSGVFLSVLGFGTGNLKDSTLERLAGSGNGNYSYIDSLDEARKVLVDQMGGTLVAIAKDVKIQIEFNPAQASAYRLIGYENRVLRHEDFNNDSKDAGDMGAGHTVTALFEVVPHGVEVSVPSVDPLKYQTAAADVRPASRDTLTLKIRYKDPDGSESRLLEIPLVDEGRRLDAASADFRFAASVASFGMILRESPHRGNASLDTVLQMAEQGKGGDNGGYRAQFIDMVKQAHRLTVNRQ